MDSPVSQQPPKPPLPEGYDEVARLLEQQQIAKAHIAGFRLELAGRIYAQFLGVEYHRQLQKVMMEAETESWRDPNEPIQFQINGIPPAQMAMQAANVFLIVHGLAKPPKPEQKTDSGLHLAGSDAELGGE